MTSSQSNLSQRLKNLLRFLRKEYSLFLPLPLTLPLPLSESKTNCSHHCNIRTVSLETKLTHGERKSLWIQSYLKTVASGH